MTDGLLGLADPQRTCVGCRLPADRSVLLRVVVREGVLVPDDRAKLPGRGAWLHRDQECLTAADRRRAFPRALRVPGPLDTHLLHQWFDQIVHQPEPPGDETA